MSVPYIVDSLIQKYVKLIRTKTKKILFTASTRLIVGNMNIDHTYFITHLAFL